MFNMNYPMYIGEPGTSDCEDICVYFPNFFKKSGYECGYCDDSDIPPPIAPPPPPPSPTPPVPSPPTKFTFAPNYKPPTDSPAALGCPKDGARCLFGLAFAQFRGEQDTPDCEEICVFDAVVREGFQCGFCDTTTVPPTQTPVTQAPVTQAPVPAPPTSGGATQAPVPAPPPPPTPTTQPVVPQTAAPVPSGGDTTFTITNDLVMDASFIPAFDAAAARWAQVITGDLLDRPKDSVNEPPREGCSYPDVVRTV